MNKSDKRLNIKTFNHTAYKSPTKHLILYKYTKKIINKLLHFIDSDFFYEE